ncbi:probable methylthioribulose-1-phosphate dehydratase [Manihot esculenta]|uniref:probable methylthioribulose-1-phosphate dehydratase n=1 Tax=Manihot esculenta TaxID=3983 RepID=UPI001CC63148|nr:probable methylthioribulose-1-phosphate dehydratase [Manihot esculenta]
MATAAAPAAVNGGGKVTSQAYLESIAVKDTRVLIADLCRQFYNLGWVSGTGGSITIKVHDDSIPKPQQLILMSPSGKYCRCYAIPKIELLCSSVYMCCRITARHHWGTLQLHCCGTTGCAAAAPSSPFKAFSGRRYGTCPPCRTVPPPLMVIEEDI